MGLGGSGPSSCRSHVDRCREGSTHDRRVTRNPDGSAEEGVVHGCARSQLRRLADLAIPARWRPHEDVGAPATTVSAGPDHHRGPVNSDPESEIVVRSSVRRDQLRVRKQRSAPTRRRLLPDVGRAFEVVLGPISHDDRVAGDRDGVIPRGEAKRVQGDAVRGEQLGALCAARPATRRPHEQIGCTLGGVLAHIGFGSGGKDSVTFTRDRHRLPQLLEESRIRGRQPRRLRQGSGPARGRLPEDIDRPAIRRVRCANGDRVSGYRDRVAKPVQGSAVGRGQLRCLRQGTAPAGWGLYEHVGRSLIGLAADVAFVRTDHCGVAGDSDRDAEEVVRGTVRRGQFRLLEEWVDRDGIARALIVDTDEERPVLELEPRPERATPCVNSEQARIPHDHVVSGAEGERSVVATEAR